MRKIILLILASLFITTTAYSADKNTINNVHQVQLMGYKIVMNFYKYGIKKKDIKACQQLYKQSFNAALDTEAKPSVYVTKFLRVLFDYARFACFCGVADGLRGLYLPNTIERFIKKKLTNWGCQYGVCDWPSN